MLFYIGVPVNSKILLQTSFLSCTSIFAFWFLSLWASSTTMYWKGILKKIVSKSWIKTYNYCKYFITSDENVELVDIFILLNITFKSDVIVKPLITPELVPALDRVYVIVKQGVQIGPFPSSPFPVSQSTQRRNYQKWSSIILEVYKVIQEGDCLYCFT